MRIVFLMGSWQDGIEFNDELLNMATQWEDKLNSFFLRAHDLAETNPVSPNTAADDTTDSDQQVADLLKHANPLFTKRYATL